jgi:hypothetical protein
MLVRGKVKAKNVGKPILPCKFGGSSSHYGLCDLETAINVIIYEFYMEIQNELHPTNVEDTNMTIMFADKSLRIPMVLLKDAYICIDTNIFPIDCVMIDMPADYSCPIILEESF